MATELGVGYVSVVPSAQGFGRALNQQIDPALAGSTGRMSAGFGGMFRSVAAAGGATLATVGIGQFVQSAVAEARDAEKIARETATRIESTGASAWTSASQVETLAGRLSDLVGIDDDAIQSGANLLLTFKNVRNELGRGNDIFDQANGLALDMSAAFKQDLGSSAVQLGKALDDPIRGVSALRRVGVSFTRSQEDQIKALVESGNVLEAQKIILGELESQVGGTAAATADPWQKFGVVVGDVKEQIGAALIPALNAAATWLAEKLPKALADLQVWFNRNRATFEEWGERIQNVSETVVRIVTTLWDTFGETVVEYVIGSFSAVFKIIDGVMQAISGLFDIVLGVLTLDWDRAWNGMKDLVGGVWDAIVGIISGVLNTVKSIISAALDVIGVDFDDVWTSIKDTVGGALMWIADTVGSVTSTIADAWRTVWGGVGAFFSDVWDGIKRAAVNGVNWIIDHIINPFIYVLNVAIDLLNKLPGVDIGTIGPVSRIETPQIGERPVAGDDVRMPFKTIPFPINASAAVMPAAAGGGSKFTIIGAEKSPRQIAEEVDRVHSWKLSLSGER